MIPFLLRRLLSAVPTLLGAALAAYLILNLLPSDPVLTWSGDAALPSAEAMQLLRSELRVDRGPMARLAAWALALLHGDLGRSLRDGRMVSAVIAAALPWTLLLNGTAVLVIYGLALPFGLVGAAAAGSVVDRLGRALLLVLYAVPGFASALLLQQWLAVRLRVLPLQGVGGDAAGTLGRAGDLAWHMALPVACLAFSGWAFVARYARAAFRSDRGREILAAARARGLSRARAWMHVGANAAVPLATLLAALVPGLVGGSIIVEQVFSWPGVGRLYLSAIEARDYPVVLALTLLSALAVVAGQILVDLLYVVADPRTKERLLGDADV
jgi:peptide/nickel transport system permease protein